MIIYYEKERKTVGDMINLSLFSVVAVLIITVILSAVVIKKPTLKEQVVEMNKPKAKEEIHHIKKENKIPKIEKKLVPQKFSTREVLYLYDHRELSTDEYRHSWTTEIRYNRVAIIDTVNKVVYLYNRSKKRTEAIKLSLYNRSKWRIRKERIISQDDNSLQLTTITHNKDGSDSYDITRIPTLAELNK